MQNPLAMHMADMLLSAPVAAAALLVAGAAVWASARRVSKTLSTQELSLMGVMGAFVFAAQMINFTLPFMPGTSGHLGGAVLLAIILGPWAATVTMATILIVQCLLFADGGLLALGCNIINMGVVPAFVGWGIWRALVPAGRTVSAARRYLTVWAAAVVGVTAGAALVPVQAAFSGVLAVPTRDFLAVMVGVHLLIGLVEGLITFAVLGALDSLRPGLIQAGPPADPQPRAGTKPVVATLLATAILLAGVVSWFASAHPDGLEWSYQHKKYQSDGAVIANDSSTVASAEALLGRVAPWPDYALRESSAAQAETEQAEALAGEHAPDGWGSLIGLVGTGVTLGCVYGLASLLRRRRAGEPA